MKRTRWKDPRVGYYSQIRKLNSLKDKVVNGLNSPQEILAELRSESVSLSNLVEWENISKSTLETLISLLVHACKDESGRDVLAVLNEVGSSDSFVFHHIVRYLSAMSKETSAEYEQQLYDLLQFFGLYQRSFPASASQKILVILPLVDAALDNLKQCGKNPLRHEDLIKAMRLQKGKLVSEVKCRKRQWEELFQMREPPDDFRLMPIVPKTTELLSRLEPFLRPNLRYGNYQSVDHYLDVQFRLLREDYVRPLRDAVQKLEQVGISPKSIREVSDVNVYLDGTILGAFASDIGVVHRLKFDYSRLRHVQWRSSKRFLPGSLLCLTHDAFQTVFFATVATREVNLLRMGIVYVIFEKHPLLYTIEQNQYVILETSTYFEAYKHNLLALQKIDKLPFERYLVNAEKYINTPDYISYETKFDLSPVLSSSTSSEEAEIYILSDSSWPDLDSFELDYSQLRALKTCLTSEFAIIQGPPGTGKSFIGTKVVEILLKNSCVWSETDTECILVVCYTNHALDQFLENVLKVKEDSVKLVRVGGRSESALLQDCNLNYLRQSRSWSFDRKKVWKLRCICEEINHDIQKRSGNIAAAFSVVVTLRDFSMHMSKMHLNSFVKFSMFALGIDPFLPNNYIFVVWLYLDAVYRNFLEEYNPLANEAGIVEQLNKGLQMVEDEEFDVPAYTDKIIDEDIAIPSTDPSLNPGKSIMIEFLWRKYLYDWIQNIEELSEGEENARDIWELDFEHRWRLYRLWVRRYVEDQNAQLDILRARLDETERILKDTRTSLDVKVLKSAKIIGMTTTGAAKYGQVLSEICPRIVIIEEAAEVLESHIISCITSKTTQLLLIGDHKQLRPNTAVYELSKKYHMDVSLFERMLNNGLACNQLEIQHRMKPDFRKLLVPEFYEKLFDHFSVTDYPSIKGISSSMFFLQHAVDELHATEGKSHSNIFEAEFVVALAQYLINQGYAAEEITILTTYSGQMFLIREKQRHLPAVSTVRTTVVDNFQGEENEIIILSFVRSNSHGSIGFLRIPNRVCVSLSRARKGLYCVGNFEMFAKHSDVWKNIVTKLKDQKALGPALTLHCAKHPDAVTLVSSAADFSKVPDGGCQLPCEFRLPCGHSCSKKCHWDGDDHQTYLCLKKCVKKCPKGHPCPIPCSKPCSDKCKKPCNTVYEDCKHPCPLKCWETCSDKCKLPCEKSLQCGHPCTNLCAEKCTRSCLKKVIVTGSCGHSSTTTCSNKLCHERCEKLLPCGHRCPNECHEDCSDDCSEKVVVIFSCEHENKVECRFANLVNLAPKCAHPCGELLACKHECKKECGSPCACSEHVKVILTCGHDTEKPCSGDASRAETSGDCSQKCTKSLDCGHPCQMACNESCDLSQCPKLTKYNLPCGHRKSIACSKRSTVTPDMCRTPCNYKLECGHTCSSVCGKRLYGGIHHCLQKCTRTLPCGHACKGKCGKQCIPCNEKCESACPHMSCLFVCGYPCLPCKMPCKRSCPHVRCSRACHEPCDVDPCNEPCPRFLRCQHRCSGSCGEPCPAVCRVCNRSLYFALTKGKRYAPLTRLYPCGHSVAVDELSKLLQLDDDSHTRCPTCSVIVWFSFRHEQFFRERQARANARKQEIVDEHGKVPKCRFEFWSEVAGRMCKNIRFEDTQSKTSREDNYYRDYLRCSLFQDALLDEDTRKELQEFLDLDIIDAELLQLQDDEADSDNEAYDIDDEVSDSDSEASDTDNEEL